ncbi:MAG: hypothetical protein JXB88_06000 [Spirochaetales bacterium]|nr:hypothetical protein [Spirochaetales bacterium]
MHIIKRCISYFHYLIVVLLCVVYFLFHFHFMPQYVDWDQALYGHNIIKAIKLDITPIFNPPHLHEEICGIHFHRFIEKNLGNAGFTDIVFNNRIRSLLFACIGIYFTVLYLKNTTGKFLWGLLGGMLISVCHGYLVFAAKVDTAIFPLAGLTATLWMLDRITKTRNYLFFYAVIAGILLFLNIMFHQYMGIACVAFCITLLLPSFLFPEINPAPFMKIRTGKRPAFDRKPKIRYSFICIAAFICLLFTGAAYFYTGVSVYHLPFDKPSPNTSNGPFKNWIFQKWIFFYGSLRGYGHGYRKWDPKKPFRGYTNAFLSPVKEEKKRYDKLSFNYKVKNFFEKGSFIHNQVALFSVIGLFCPLIFIPVMWKRYRRGFFFILFSLVLYILFVTYWEPYYYEFWLIPCYLVCILAIQFFNLAGEHLAGFFRGLSQFPFYLYIIFIILCLFSFNSERHIIPYSRERRVEELYHPWTEEEFLRLFSTTIYRYSENPYKTLYPERKNE